MDLSRVDHCVDNILTEAAARIELVDNRLTVIWFTNRTNKQSVVHSHPYHELVMPIGGSTVRYSVNGSIYMAQPGELIYFPAQIYHSGYFTLTDDYSDRLVIQIDDALWQAAHRNTTLTNCSWMHNIVLLDQSVCQKWELAELFLRMGQSRRAPSSCRDLIFEAQIMELQLLITLATGNGQTGAPSSTSTLVQRAVAYLQTHYQDPNLTTTVLAQELYASREHLSRAFKESTMESIHGYLTHLRMQHCRQALAEGASVLAACNDSGFPDYSSFLKTFRKMYGITPAAYRAQYRKPHKTSHAEPEE